MAVRVLLPVVPDLGAAAVRPEFLPPLPLKIPEYNDSHQRILTFADFAGEKIVGGDKMCGVYAMDCRRGVMGSGMAGGHKIGVSVSAPPEASLFTARDQEVELLRNQYSMDFELL